MNTDNAINNMLCFLKWCCVMGMLLTWFFMAWKVMPMAAPLMNALAHQNPMPPGANRTMAYILASILLMCGFGATLMGLRRYAITYTTHTEGTGGTER